MGICLIDTSVFLNILNVPNRNQNKTEVVSDFEDYVNLNYTFILPMATIIETGNHIAQNGNGTFRRSTALKFVDAVMGSFEGKAPWQPAEFPNIKEILSWIDCFPALAGKNKTPTKLEGTSFGDLSIIKDFEKSCKLFPMSEVFIWSLDSDLMTFHQKQS